MEFYSDPDSLYSIFRCLNPNVDQIEMQIEQSRNPHALDASTICVYLGYLKGSHLSSGNISANSESDV